MVALAPTPSPDNGPHTVTIHLIQGQTQVGRLASFTRYQLEFVLASTVRRGDGQQQTVETRIPADQVALVGFHRDDLPRPHPRAARRKGLRVHTTVGPVICVHVDVGEIGNPLGFYGWPSDERSPYREIFFYERGIAQRESTDGLGGLFARASTRALEALSRRQAAEAAAKPAESPAAAKPAPRKRIGELLIEAGLATQRDIERALEVQQRSPSKRVGEILVEMGVVSEVDLALALANHPQAMAEVPVELLRTHLNLAVRAASDAVGSLGPVAERAADPPIVQERPHEPAVTPPPPARPDDAEEIEQILKQIQSDEEQAARPDGAKVEEDADLTASSDSAVIRLANRIILDGYRRGASDIHVEPNGRDRPTIIRFRIDGECVHYQEIPAALRAPLVARLKIMARLDISERRKPQDGKIQLRIKDQKVELRVATLPTVADNEDVVLRILAASKPLPLEKMGLSERNLRELRSLIAKPYGLVLCVGPTGSGKTTTLHSALGSINTGDMKIWTAEDPVEITQPGLRQVQVSAKIGFTFAAAMRAFLRADPDVIMVGEMRDKETAGIAVEASLTGHLVMSTLHTNSAPETLTRLLDMGLDPFSFSDALLGVLAQRLARALCKSCKEAYQPTLLEHEELSAAYGPDLHRHFGLPEGQPLTLFRARGCPECGQSGYRGRLAIHELLVVDDDTRHAISRRAPVEEIRALAMRGGMRTLLQDGLHKAVNGLTDVKQVMAAAAK